MTWLWHPTSDVRLDDPPVPVGRTMISMLVRGGGAELRYFGDRMWPTLRDEDRCTVVPAEVVGPGTVVAVWLGSRLDILRVRTTSETHLVVGGDAETGAARRVPTSDVAGTLDVPRAIPTPGRRRLRRLRLDLAEARVRLEERDDTSGTSMSVLEKYDYQAGQYSDAGAGRLTDDVLEALDRWTNTGARVLVVGSGTGAECFQLADRGLRPSGLDFSPEMTAIATENARTCPVPVRFTTADVTVHDEPARSLDAVFFTYSVYSFVRTRDARVRTLRRMRAWLRDGGTIWVSATRADDPYRRCLVAIHRVFQGGEIGDSHTRWHGKDGAIRRSYVHVFSTGEIVSELREAGLKVAEDLGSHVVATAG